eukprot:1758577-Prymnesium_polylepis.1
MSSFTGWCTVSKWATYSRFHTTYASAHALPSGHHNWCSPRTYGSGPCAPTASASPSSTFECTPSTSSRCDASRMFIASCSCIATAIDASPPLRPSCERTGLC